MNILKNMNNQSKVVFLIDQNGNTQVSLMNQDEVNSLILRESAQLQEGLTENQLRELLEVDRSELSIRVNDNSLEDDEKIQEKKRKQMIRDQKKINKDRSRQMRYQFKRN